jgi:NAD(P)-dependent dehydrogenase (short-subunit alcohol dehydrogenase family)
MALDVTLAGAPRAAVGRVVQAYGRLDILVNNAGLLVRKPAETLADAELDAMLAVNVKGAYAMCAAVLDPLRAAGRGRILNISSVGAERASRHLAAYTATKAALSQLTRGLALEWAPHRITVNAIAPGTVRTPINADYLDADPVRRQGLEAQIPQGRFGTPEDIAPLAVFLASSAADHITGQTIFVDGGRTSY